MDKRKWKKRYIYWWTR